MKRIIVLMTLILACACARIEGYWQDEKPFAYRAWKGDKESAVLVLKTDSDCCISLKSRVEGPLEVSVAFVEKVTGDLLDTTRFSQCGSRTKGEFGEIPCDDRLGDTTSELTAGKEKKVWVSVKVPQGTPSGRYSGMVKADGKRFPFEIEVCEESLPLPEDYAFNLDLWQNPYSVARFHDVPLWSEEHFSYMRPVMEMLRDAGQKYITATIMDRPWNGQTEDPFGSMVIKNRNSDGTWTYDYSVFDKYVQWMMDLGINKGINCYSMIPWRLEFDYHDMETDRDTTVFLNPQSDGYKEYWGSFLEDFCRHLKEKGWYDITSISMDERSEEDMQSALNVIRSVASDLKLSLAGQYHKSIEQELDYLSLTMLKEYPKEILERRRKEGKTTTFYVCCAEKYPNTYLVSNPDEATWLPIYALANGYDGFLRWSYNSWTENPCADARFRTWPAGDCYIVYPEGHSSVRFEKFSEGIRLCEKIRILSSRWEAEAAEGDSESASKLSGLRGILGRFTFEEISSDGASPAVKAIKDYIL